MYSASLLADGRHDRALVPILSWVLSNLDPTSTFRELRFHVRKASAPIQEEMTRVVMHDEPHLLFVHRDAEAKPVTARAAEIPDIGLPVVRVIPVRMTEAWLLPFEAEIRHAADNPHGTQVLNLPTVRDLERLADPKQALEDALLQASELPQRRQSKISRLFGERKLRVAQRVHDFAQLRQLPAFQQLEDQVGRALSTLNATV